MKRLFIFLFIMFIGNQLLVAKHIVGGAFSLQHVSGNRYTLTLKVLRDCNSGGAEFDDPATVGVFDKKTNALVETYQMNISTQSILNFAGSNCNNGIPNTCTSLGIYTKNITLNITQFNNNDGYYFSYQRCCRNSIISNILEPGDAGIAIYMEIPPPRNIINSTPYFSANPNTYLCVGSLTRYNLDFKDNDGDVLKYSFVTPLNGNLDKINPASNTPSQGPYPQITWFGAHNAAQQIIGTPSLFINEATGELSVNPIQSGVYVVAIRVEEFRLGIKIGEVRLDLQFNVTDCPQPIPQLILKNSTGALIGNNIEIITPQIGCFDIVGSDISDSIFMSVKNVSLDTTILTKPIFQKTINGFKQVTNRVCWEAACDLPQGTTQQIKVELVDNGCPFPTRNALTINIKIVPMPLMNATDILCMSLIDDKATNFYWGDSTVANQYFHKYNIYRGINSTNFVLLDSVLNKTTRSYLDQNTPNYSVTNYQYFMRGVNHCMQEGPTSDTLGTFEQLKYIPNQQKLITATVFQKDKVKIIWPQSDEKDFAQYLIFKTKRGSENFQLIQSFFKVTDTSYIDKDVEVNNYSYCYYVIMKDTCDNYGPKGLEACTILLDGKSSAFVNAIKWNPYTYWETGTKNYQIVIIGNESPSQKNKFVASEPSQYLDDNLDTKSGIFYYSVIANQKSDEHTLDELNGLKEVFGQAQSESNTIELVQKPLVHIPNAFSPNQDGLNEQWNIKDVFVKDYQLIVFNKWGQLVFQSDTKNRKWEGTSIEGLAAPSDVYIYKLSYTGYDNSSFTKTGNVTILR